MLLQRFAGGAVLLRERFTVRAPDVLESAAALRGKSTSSRALIKEYE